MLFLQQQILLQQVYRVYVLRDELLLLAVFGLEARNEQFQLVAGLALLPLTFLHLACLLLPLFLLHLLTVRPVALFARFTLLL